MRRANDLVERSKLVNMAQFAHGINSTRANVEWWLDKIAKGESITDKGKPITYGDLNKLHDCVMKLGGYLYALKEGIE